MADLEDIPAFTFFERNGPSMQLSQSRQVMENLKKNALFNCHYLECAAEVSYNMGMLRLDQYERPICENCYDNEHSEKPHLADMEDRPIWSDLHEFNPFRLVEIDHVYDLILLDALFRPMNEFTVMVKKVQKAHEVHHLSVADEGITSGEPDLPCF
jgi:hypothetical protein